ncbi:hypothetical protein GUJ93_ZPchr0008g11658 [Zizania palustris]|uniref:Uncharacterized protein n=1 Tax=Zizania palustris TaxID=103762 RepID=A0A8J5RK43_ZIZPA|nr:hypothetical protein GUJ93_ZPchr0008g11658 [Zizania palustris]
METQRQQQQQQQQQQEEEEDKAASTASAADDIGRPRSPGDHEAQSPSPELVEPSGVSRRSSFRNEGRRKKRLLMYDESLEDTATSPISNPKLIDSRGSYDKHKNRENNAHCDEISDIVKNTTTDELGGCNSHVMAGTNTSTDMINDNADDHSNEQMRKKGLCLVPLSISAPMYSRQSNNY